MLKILLLAGCLGLLAFSGHSQEVFTPQECEAFVQLYFAQKAAARESRAAKLPPLEKFSVSQDRYAAIVKAKIADEPLVLSNNERSLLEAIALQQQEFKKEKKARIENDATQQVLSAQKYEAILKRYSSEIKFQRSLKPYFDQYLQNQKGR